MKSLFGPALLLGAAASACNLIPHPTHQREAITAYVVRTIDDPDSYQALWWGTPRVLSRAEKARMDRIVTLQLYATANQTAQAESSAYRAARTSQLARPSFMAPTAALRRHCLHSGRTRDSLRYVLRHLSISKDTTRYGYLIAHGYRAVNRTGQPFRDSALFLVDVEANVVRWDALKKPGK